MSPQRQPVVFLPHGGGPWPFVDVGFGDPRDHDAMAKYLRSLRDLPKSPPKAILMVSAHWEAPSPTVMTSAHPPMLYDYSGFPAESYTITWPAPGSPELAARVRSLLGAAGHATAEDASRGFDHGAFVPLKLMWPEAEVPTIQLSLQRGLDPAVHLSIGRALAPLRDEGVFIVGSGMTFHNMRGFGDRRLIPQAEAFDTWLQQASTAPRAERDAALEQWERAPGARLSHPREEHLLPLMVIAGAAGNDVGTIGFTGRMMGLPLSAFHFG
jgi:aromatic ring-opening dioxygenase catalytic subunit (LigB family)